MRNSVRHLLRLLLLICLLQLSVEKILVAQIQFRKPTWQDIQGNTKQTDLKNNRNSGPPASDFSGISNQGKVSSENSPATSGFQFAGDTRSSAPANNGKESSLTIGSQSSLPKPIVTRQQVFGVPFSVSTESAAIREVQLHVSSNRGNSWSLYSRQFPNAKEFPFRAVQDGEYWFAVKTVGTQIPDRKLQPELIIAIDTRKPNFNISVKTDALGRLVVNWRATDENLDPKSIKLSYQSVSNWGRQQSVWQEVSLPAPDASIDNIYEDEIAFYANTSNVSLDLKVSIADKAGNVAMAFRRYNLPRTAMNQSRNSQQGGRQFNVASRTSSAGKRSSWPFSRADARVANSGAPGAIPSNSSTSNSSTSNSSTSNSSTSSRPPSTDPYSAFTQKDKDDAATRVGMEASFDPGRSGTLATNSSTNSSGDSANGKVASTTNRQQGWHFQGNAGFQQDFYNNQPSENEWNQSQDNRPSSVVDPGFQNPTRLASSGRNMDEAEQAFQRGSNINRIPSGQYAKLSSSKKFELDYQVDHIEPDDISKLEIWVTQDAGQSWKLQTTDRDRQSPVVIEVNEDGVYGYRIRIQTVDGLESVQPTAGDSADVWVEVDTTRPSVRLDSIPYGRRRDAGKLIINWTATDRRLAAKPITLYYSVNLDGPWQIIVEKLDNSGQFKWPVTDRVPRNVYLRIEAIDAAGNRNFHQTEQPIDLSGLNPRGMIRSVRPIDRP